MKYNMLKTVAVLMTVLMVGLLSACSIPFLESPNAKYEGEWLSSGESYYVFNKDGSLEWYKDSSKGDDNVAIGTWVVEQEKENFFYKMKITEMTIDGETRKIENSVGYEEVELGILEFNGDSMKVINSQDLSTYTLTRQ